MPSENIHSNTPNTPKSIKSVFAKALESHLEEEASKDAKKQTQAVLEQMEQKLPVMKALMAEIGSPWMRLWAATEIAAGMLTGEPNAVPSQIVQKADDIAVALMAKAGIPTA